MISPVRQRRKSKRAGLNCERTLLRSKSLLPSLEVEVLEAEMTDFYRSLEGSFSAGSAATIATKYSFFQDFRDLQNYLAKFAKILAKFPDFYKKMLIFAKIPDFFRNFANFLKI
jgi:hypothetical protein